MAKRVKAAGKKRSSGKRKPGENIPEGARVEGLVAVIVGIDGYGYKRSLQCAVNDAVYLDDTLKKVWKDRDVFVKTLIWPSLNENKAKTQQDTWGIELPGDAAVVSCDGILSAVREFSALAREEDTFVFFFAGHGTIIDGEPVLVTVGDGSTADGIDFIKIKEIQAAAAGSRSGKKVMILDCCQTMVNENKPVEKYMHPEELTAGWSILLSSSPGESSLEDHYSGDSSDDYLQQGVFTAILAEGLRGGARGSSGSVSLADLAYFVGKRVPVEYQERWDAWFKLGKLRNPDRELTDTRGIWSYTQNPVLLSDAVSMDGPYRIVMAPEYVPAAHDARRKIPGQNFLKTWFKFLKGPWPIDFPSKFAFRLAGFLYAVAVMFTVMWNSQDAIHSTSIQIFSCAAGLGSAFIWWITLPFAAAANEDRWHIGGYFTPLFYFLWHCIVISGFIWIYNSEPPGIRESIKLGSLIFELFFLFVGVVIYCCNASQTIIALAETVRKDERRDIRQAIRVFQQFKYTLIGVDLFNYVAQTSLRPDAYMYAWLISITLVGGSLLSRVAEGFEGYAWVIIVREILVMALVTWLVFWYYAAYKAIQFEVYKR